MTLRTARIAAAFFALSGTAAVPAIAQSNIHLTNKYAWGENVGFINFRDPGSPIAAQGVRINGSYLSGFAWGENIGYIKFGNSAGPANGASYTNPLSGPIAGIPDYGVNRNPTTGHLTGYAWGENVGWINFGGGALATPANPARFDVAAHRFRGYVWGENIGWINLDDTATYVATCPADFDGNGILAVADIFAFLNAWFAGDPAANFDGIGGLQVADIFAFLNAWFAGC